MKPILEIQNISKRFRIQHELHPYETLRSRAAQLLIKNKSRTSEEFWALKDVSFNIQAGESFGIIGKNGAGKSTLLKILSKITPPTTGKIVCRGRIASLLEVGTGFHPELTGRENILLNGSILGMRKKEILAKFDEIVDFSGVEKFLDTPLKHYSSGMQLRLAFAVAAFLEPEILIIDEVLAVGDAEFQKKCMGKMDEVTKSGRTILFVSHNMLAVRNLCSKAILLDHGSIIKNSSVDECIHYYINSFQKNGAENHSASIDFNQPKNKSMWINKAEIRSNGNLTNVIRMGDTLSLFLNITCRQSIGEPKIGFVISNEEGSHLLNANNHYQNAEIEGKDFIGDSNIQCHLGVVPFNAGRYYITLYLSDHTQNHQVIENAISFEVVAHDIWGRSSLPPTGVSQFWWPTNIKIKQLNN